MTRKGKKVPLQTRIIDYKKLCAYCKGATVLPDPKCPYCKGRTVNEK